MSTTICPRGPVHGQARRRLLAGCATLAIFAASCSSNDDDTSAATTVVATTTTTSPAPAPTATDAEATTSTPSTDAPATADTVAATDDTTPDTTLDTTPETDVSGSTTTTIPRPDGPAADLSEELTGGNGVFIAAGSVIPLEAGYVEHEYVAAGTATSYTPGDLTADGRWTFTPDATAAYRTRVLVRRPENAADFSGNVIVEWLNVSGGLDADPDFEATREEITRSGDIWVGVSAQLIGVEGGATAVPVPVSGADSVAGKGLKGIDPVRYGSLQHPGDGYSFDIFTQVARALRLGGDPLGGFTPKHLVAAGESQSAFAMVTYVNGVQPLTHEFDGFFVHSRGAVGLSLAPPGAGSDIARSLSGTPAIVRTDTDVPIFDLQTESDVAGILNSVAARQPDSDLFRVWEVAGTAHADAHTLGSAATSIDCSAPINDGPLHVVAKAALHHFITWVDDGTLPPTAPLLDVADAGLQRDADGIALGGLRTPPVDVPDRILSSTPGRTDQVICILLGSTQPMTAERLATLYASPADYQQQYDAAVDRAIASGYVLADDRAALEAYAHPELIVA